MINKNGEEHLRSCVRSAFEDILRGYDKNDLINTASRARNIVDDEMTKIFWEIQNGNFKED